MKFSIRTILLLLLLSQLNYAQVDSVYYGNRAPDKTKKEKTEKPKDDWRESLVWGGTFQAWFGNQTFVFLAPSVGYPIYKNLLVGLGIVYNYSSYRGPYGSYSQSIFGGQSYLRYTIRNSYFLQATFDRLLQPNPYAKEPNSKTWVNYFMVGGGFRHPLSDNSAFTTSLMYYVNPSILSIYPNRLIIQFGITGKF